MSLKFSVLLIVFLLGMNSHKSGPASSGQNQLSENSKRTLLYLVNQARSKGCKCGNLRMKPVAAVTWDEQLEAAAEKHSLDMYKNGFLGHNGSDGSTFSARITREGFKWSGCAENIAEGYETEREVIDGWLNSPGHCRNLMSPHYRYMGIGRVGNYWTQDFAGRQ